MKSFVSILITTYNEQVNIEDCLISCRGWSSDVYIVDSFSADQTLSIAESYGVSIYQHEYESPAAQKNWALDNLPFRNEWVLILDADERLTPELGSELAEIVLRNGDGYDGYYVNRKYIFYGKWIRRCGWYPNWNLRFFKHRLGRYEERIVHEHVLLNGRVGYCKNDLIHEDRRDFMDWMVKQNRWAVAEAHERYKTYKQAGNSAPIKNIFFGDPVQRKRAIKERLWMRLPGRSLLRFIYLYFLRLGFLDGTHGLRFCALWGIWEYLILTYFWELKHYKEDAPPGGINTHTFKDLV